MKKRNAFTLAEILVTLGIVGVIAALTVPDLVSDYQNKTMAAKIRKATNDIETTIDAYTTDAGKSVFRNTSAFNNMDTFITHNFNVIKTCDANATGCFADQKYISINGTTATDTFKCTAKSYILADSTAICILHSMTPVIPATDTSPEIPATPTGELTVYVDSNGPEAPNIGGRDMFKFQIDQHDQISDTDSDGCTASVTGEGCISKLKENNWKMDY